MSSTVQHDSKNNIGLLNKVGLPFGVRYYILLCNCDIKASTLLSDTLMKEIAWSSPIIPIKRGG